MGEIIKHLAEVRHMAVEGGVVHQDVIEEHDDKTVKEWFQELVHCCLKCGGHIAQTKWHHFVFRVSLLSAECSLSNIIRRHQNLVKPLSEIQFGEPRCRAKFIKKLIYGRHWEAVLHGHYVQLAIVHTKAPFAILLFYQKDR